MTHIPRWWFGVPVAGILFSALASRFFPAAVEWMAFRIYALTTGEPAPASLPPAMLGLVAFFMGILLAVAVSAVWRLGRRARHSSSA